MRKEAAVGAFAGTRARCAGADVDQFFGREHEPLHATRARLAGTAVHYCAPCPLLQACRISAAVFHAEGLWGGVLHRRVTGGHIEHHPLLPAENDQMSV